MSAPNNIEEVSAETQAVLRFLLRDDAFSVEFLITAIQEYYDRNKKPGFLCPSCAKAKP